MKRVKQDYKWDHNNNYHDYLLRFVLNDCKVTVDIGCGTGEFARKSAFKSNQVYGFDLSHISINKAIDFSEI
jgi:2-polyprenyl-3-methyl-5-hydroxy-6-metoxy-1,4-benzoquinol methylase